MIEPLLLLGPPGTGKTTRLLGEMQKRIESGVPASRIAFISFTRSAVRDARRLVMAPPFGRSPEELQYFRTLHSLCFYGLSLKKSDVFGREALSYLSDITGEELTGKMDLEAPTLGERGDALLFLDQLARSTLTPLEDAWRAHDTPIDWYRLKRFTDAYTTLKRDLGLLDFTDMLERYVATGTPMDVDVALCDEAQDFTPLQWKVINRAFGGVKELIISGDDEQNLYQWAGSSAQSLLSWPYAREVLQQSYRLPRKIWELATQVASRIKQRWVKAFHPTDQEGRVEWLGRPEEADLSTGSWLLLARTRRQLVSLVNMARDQGVVHTIMGRSVVNPEHVRLIQEYERQRAGDPSVPLWHDALQNIPLEEREFLLSCLRRGESLTREPRVRIETIHGAKGLEASNVLLLTDLNARIQRGMELDPDAENRVLYVALTRARESLYLVVPQRHGFGYQL